jgi:ribosome-associated protein
VKARLRTIAGTRMTKDGVIVLTARSSRDQARNRAEARARLVALIAEAAEPRRPRRPTRPSKASRTARTDAKTQRGGVKLMRKKPRDDD